MAWSEGILGKMREKRITQEEMASFMGISRPTLMKKINNEAEFTVRDIIKICDILKISDKEKYFFNHKCSKLEHDKSAN